MLSILKNGNIREGIGSLKNPNTILIKNRLYPSGLTELDIQNYYLKNKKNILEQTKDREVMLFVQTDKGIIVKRKDSGGFYRLRNDNYEKLIHGRVISIHSTMNQNEDFGIVDIDTDSFQLAKTATKLVYDYLKGFGDFKFVEIRYTGKKSFHVFVKLRNQFQIDRTRLYLKQLLKNKFEGKYEIAGTRKPGQVNLDLSSNKYRGGFITLGSLSIIGLKCMKVTRNSLSRFNINQTKIK